MATVMPQPVIERLLILSRFLEHCGVQTISSSELEASLGWSSHTIRRDISYLGGEVAGGSGYAVEALKKAIREHLGFNQERTYCIVGLGRLGSAYLYYPGFAEEGFRLVAGFDASVNRIEILSAPVPLYPSYKMGEVIQRFGIELALLCVPPQAAQSVAEKLVAAGIRGIVNFVPVSLKVAPEVVVRNVYAVDELRAVSTRIFNTPAQTPPDPSGFSQKG